MRKTGLFFAFIGLFISSWAQKSIQDSTISMGFLSIVYSPSLPGGDFGDRFGFTNLIGFEGGYKFGKNFYAYGGVRFIFGNEVREAIAPNVLSYVGSPSTGYQTYALGSDGRYYTVRLWERGLSIPLIFGKIFKLPGSNNFNSGIYVEAGPQFIQHKVHIIPVGNAVPNLVKPYLKGYDRLTNGIGIVEGFGYRHFSNNRFTNFFLGVELSQNFTQGRRDINYDTGLKDDEPRMDLLYGLKFGWTFPIYRSAPEKVYYY